MFYQNYFLQNCCVRLTFSLDAKTPVVKGGLGTVVNQNVLVKTMQHVILQVVIVIALVDGG